MAKWIFKQEPTCYSFSDLQRDGRTVWDGVSNALARKNLRQIKSRRSRPVLSHRQRESGGAASCALTTLMRTTRRRPTIPRP